MYNNIIMEYQKIANWLNDASNQPSKLDRNDESRGTNSSNDTEFKTTMLRSTLCDYADAYILVKGTITITGAGMMMLQNDQMKEMKAQLLKIVHYLVNA